MTNQDPEEVAKFDEIAQQWWDSEGPMKPLHQLNPLRQQFITDHLGDVSGKRILDVGCGGGILSETLARAGADVIGIDAATQAIQAAKDHASAQEVPVEYHAMTLETFAANTSGGFDAITCMEMLEHVPSPAALIPYFHSLLKPGGQLFLSTLNRNLKSYLLAIIGAEYVLKLLPRGTHDYGKFIKPSELSRWLRQSGFRIGDMTGIHYNPFNQQFRLGSDVSVNYLLTARRADV